MLNRDQAKRITDAVLSISKADETSVSLDGGTTTHLRFARNTPSTSGSFESPSLTIDCMFGKRTGSATINQFDTDSLTRGVRQAEAAARLAPEDPEHMPLLGPQTYPTVDAFSERTATDGPVAIADGAATCIKAALDAKLIAAGFTRATARYDCIANSRGLFGYHRSTGAYMAETVRTEDATGSGWAAAASHKVEDIDFARVSRTAIDKAVASRAPKPLAPGKYTTILEPACVANLVRFMTFSMNTRSADEGRSFFSSPTGGTRRGETLFDTRVNLYSDPTDSRVPGTPWGSGGQVQKRRDWVKDGVLTDLFVDRYWAQKTGVEPIPSPSNLIMTGGEGSVDDLVASTERGLLVTSLWYIRFVDPRTLLFTGLTRDGVFLIEDGKIKHPVQNFRWNDSPIRVLKNIEAMTAPVSMPPRPWRSATTIVPALKVSEFHFTSVSEAV